MVRVIYNNGLVREYSQEVHGDSYKELAAEFAKKFNGTIEGEEPKVGKAKESNDSNIKIPTEREILVAKATGLGLEFAKNVKTTVLAEMVAEAEKTTA